MFFRALTFFLFPAMLDLEDLEGQLIDAKLRPIGPNQLSTRGFVSPFGRGNMCYVHSQSQYHWITLGGEDRLLPPAVLAEELSKRITLAEAEQGRKLGGRARKRLREDVIMELLPRAFLRPMRLNAMLDMRHGFIAIDTSTRKAAESLVSELRNALGSFPALPLNPEASVRATLSDWIANEFTVLPKGLTIGDECVLKDPSDSGHTVRVAHGELHTEEVQNHLKAGMQVVRLGLFYNERISFTLDEDLIVRKLKFLDGVVEELDQIEADSLAAELDARFALMSPEVANLFTLLRDTFNVSMPFDTDSLV